MWNHLYIVFWMLIQLIYGHKSQYFQYDNDGAITFEAHDFDDLLISAASIKNNNVRNLILDSRGTFMTLIQIEGPYTFDLFFFLRFSALNISLSKLLSLFDIWSYCVAAYTYNVFWNSFWYSQLIPFNSISQTSLTRIDKIIWWKGIFLVDKKTNGIMTLRLLVLGGISLNVTITG